MCARAGSQIKLITVRGTIHVRTACIFITQRVHVFVCFVSLYVAREATTAAAMMTKKNSNKNKNERTRREKKNKHSQYQRSGGGVDGGSSTNKSTLTLSIYRHQSYHAQCVDEICSVFAIYAEKHTEM